MSKFKKFVTIALAGLVLVSAIPAANAQTSADTQAQITALMAQISALQSQLGTSGSVSSYTFTRNLTVGSKGADVTALQNFLIARGYLSASATGYFGALTKAAVAKWQAAAGISPAAGYFGSISRAAMQSAMSAGTGTGTGGGVVPPTTGTGVSVSVASDNPVAASIATNSGYTAPMLALNFTAGASDVVVTGLNVKRSGLSSDQDLNIVYLMDGSAVIASNLGISNSLINFSNAAGLFTVKAGTTKKIVVSTSFASTASAGKTFAFSLAGASAVTAGSATVSGAFPVTGNTMTAATVTNNGTLIITTSSAGVTAPGLTVNAGQTNFMVGQFSLQAQNQAISVKSITLTQTGSVAPSDVSNYVLMNGGTKIGTVAGLTGNTVTFDLSANPLQLAAGQTAVLSVYTDIVGGVNRYFQLSLQHNYDITAQDMMFNVGVLGSLNSGSFPQNLSYVTIQQGTLTVNRSVSSPVNYALPGGTNQTIAKFDFKASGEAVRITSLTVNALAGGTMGANHLNNLKLVDDAGQQIGTAQSASTSLATFTSLNYIVPANTTRVVSVIVDIASAATGTIQAGLSAINGQGYTSLSSVGPLQATGNSLSASTNVLTVTQNGALGATTAVAGGLNLKVASFAFTAGPASGVNVSNFSLMASTTAADFQNLYVKANGVQIGSTQATLTSGTTYNFSASTPISIAAGQQVIVDVYADSKTGAATTTAVLVVLPANSVSGIVSNTSQAVTNTPAALVNGQNVSLVAAGSLTYQAATMPQGSQLGMGVSAVKLASYRVNGSTNEDMTVNDVVLNVTSTAASLMNNYRLMVGSTQYPASGQNLSGSSITFYGVNIPVAKNANPTIDVLADVSTWSNIQATGAETATTTPTTTVAISSINYQGVASSQTGSATSSAAGNTFQVLRTTLTPATGNASVAGSVTNGAAIGSFTFTAGPNDDAFISSTTIGISFAGATTTATTTLIYVYDGSTLLGTSTIGLSGSTTTVQLTQNVTTGYGLQITKGTSRTLTVKADLTTAGFARTTSGSAFSLQIQLTAMTWTDGTRLGLAADPSVVMPINGSTAALSL